jgi:hypothetical protein
MLERNANGEGIKSLTIFSRVLLFWLIDLRDQTRRMTHERHVRFVALIEKRLGFKLVTGLEQFGTFCVNVINHERQMQKSWRGLTRNLHQLEVHICGRIRDERGRASVRVMLAATTHGKSQCSEMGDGGFNVVNAQGDMV